jgi:hypothetical protein
MNDEYNKEHIKRFADQIISLQAHPTGTGLSYGGEMGSSSTNQHALEDLKRKALQLVEETHKSEPSHDKIRVLYKDIEGGLHANHTVGVIDGSRFDNLMFHLHETRGNKLY